MLVKVKDLKPNPFRRIEEYPLSQEKVDALKLSIEELFLGSFNARPASDNKGYEIICGHHRLQALKDLGVDEVESTIDNYTDDVMVSKMVDENSPKWNRAEDVVRDVKIVKEYIEGLLNQYSDFNSFSSHVATNGNMIFASNSQFENCKKNGIGRTTIKKLCKTLDEHKIEDALYILRSKTEVDDKAFKNVKTLGQARDIAEVLKKNNIPKEQQKEVVEMAIDFMEAEDVEEKVLPAKKVDGTYGGHDRIKAAVELAAEKKGHKTDKKYQSQFQIKNEKPDINLIMRSVNTSLSKINASLTDVLNYWEYIEPSEIEEFKKYVTNFLNIIKEKGNKTCQKLLQ